MVEKDDLQFTLISFVTIALLVSILIPATNYTAGTGNAEDNCEGKELTRTQLVRSDDQEKKALFGTVPVESLEVSRIIGESIPPPGGRFGWRINVGDYNGDGNDDLAIMSTQPPPPPQYMADYRRYIIYGDGNRTPSIIDMTGHPYQNVALNDDNPPPPETYCDIDGDGDTDRVRGYYTDNDRSRGIERCGAVEIMFNYSRKSNTAERTVKIYGDDSSDYFGKGLTVLDINGDGLDDIIAGAPSADGFDDMTKDIGELFLFKGRNMSAFPAYMNVELAADCRIEGHQGYMNDPPEYMGDHLGRVVRSGDLNGDGKNEVMIPLYTKNLPPLQLSRKGAGVVLVYRPEDLFPKGTTKGKLGYPSALLNIEGMDIEDSFGWEMKVRDLDRDGYDDMLIGMTGSDGIDNERPRCGEVFIVWGSGTRISDLKIEGEGYEDGSIYCKGGNIDISSHFTCSSGADSVVSANLSLTSKGHELDIVWNDGTISISPGAREWALLDHDECYLETDGVNGWLNISMDLDWDCPFRGDLKASLSVGLFDSTLFTRQYPGPYNVIKDIGMVCNPLITLDGSDLCESGGRAVPGQLMELSGQEVEYSDGSGKVPEDGSVNLIMTVDGSPEDSKTLGEEKSLSMVVSNTNSHMISVAAIPEGNDLSPPPEGPDTGLPFQLELLVDTVPPDPPSNVELDVMSIAKEVSEPDEVNLTFNGRPGRELDNGGSGVSHYIMENLNGKERPVTEKGGLAATYFSDVSFMDEAVITVEGDMDIEWGPWGPDPNHVPPTGYSVRWHGWIHVGTPGKMRLHTSGSGEMMIFFGEDKVMDWSDLRTSPKTTYYDPGDREMVWTEIYYRLVSGISKIQVSLEDGAGNFGTLSEADTLHPANSTTILDRMGDTIHVSVMAVDWVGWTSNSTDSLRYIDKEGPEFDLSSIGSWYGPGTTNLEIEVKDPKDTLGNGSGLAIDTLEYSLIESMDKGPEWTRNDLLTKIEEGTEEAPSSIRATFPVGSESDWKGYLIFRMSDNLGNVNITNPSFIGFDSTAPVIELISPITEGTLDGPILPLELRITDIGGAGVRGSTFKCRYRSGEGRWSDWIDTDLTRNGEILNISTELNIGIGQKKVQFAISDMTDNLRESDIYGFHTVEVKENSPPRPVIGRPANGSLFKDTDDVLLDATGTFDDGLGPYKKIKLTWFSNISGMLGCGNTLLVSLPAGTHRITLFADDGADGHNRSTYVILLIIEQDEMDEHDHDEPLIKEEEDHTLYVVLTVFFSIIVVGLMLIALIRIRSSRIEDTSRLPVRERTPDEMDLERDTEMDRNDEDG